MISERISDNWIIESIDIGLLKKKTSLIDM